MSNTIENRVVQLEFEHKEFEKSIDKSIDALDKFDDRLGDFAGSIESIDKNITFKGLQNAVDSVNFDTLTEGALESQSSFDSLEGRLKDFSNNVKEINKDTNFDTIQKSINNLNFRTPLSGIQDFMAAIQEAVEQVKIGFEREIGANLASKLEKLIKSLSIDQISDGFSKYTSSTKDIVAIMNQADMSMEDVEDRVEKLSWYSDATSYSYTAMVQALKNFVAQGINMDTAISMIMGMGNSLSFAGLAAEEASSAFSIYSKAMGQTYMSQIQWKSLNLMSASTKKLKQQFIDAAVELGKLRKTGDETWETAEGLEVTIQSFESTLSALKGKWLDSDVMKAVFSVDYGDYTTQLYEYSKANDNLKLSINEQMEKFDAANTGIDEFGKKSFLAAQQARTLSEAINAVKDAASTIWKDVFVRVFGNAEEATEMWGNFSNWLYDIFIPPLLQISNLLQIWKDAGGRDELLSLFNNLNNVLSSIVSPIKNAYSVIFGSLSELNLVGPTRTLKLFAASLELSSESSEHLGHIFEVLFEIIQQGLRIVGFFSDIIFKLAKVLSPIIDIVLSIADYFITIFSGVLNISRLMDFLSIGVYRLGKGLIVARDALKSWASQVSEFVSKNLQPALEFIDTIWGELKSIDDYIRNLFSSWDNLITAIATTFTKIFDAINVGNIFGDLSIPANDWAQIGRDAFGGLKQGFEEGYKKVVSWVKNVFNSIIDTVKDILGIHSPSIVFFNIALMIIAGVLGGLAIGKKEIADKISEILTESKDRISENLSTILDAIGSFISTLASTLAGYIPKIGSWIVNMADEILGYVVGSLGQALGLITKYVPLIAAKIYQSLKDLFTLLKPVMAELKYLIVDVLSEAAEWVFSIVSTLLIRINDGLDVIAEFIREKLTISEALGEIFAILMADLTTFLSSVVNTITNSVENIVDTLTNKLPTVISKIINMVLSVINSITAAVPTISESITSLIVAVVNGITNSSSRILSAIGELLATIAAWFKTSGGEIFLSLFDNMLTIIFKFAKIKVMTSLAKLFGNTANILGNGSGFLEQFGKSIKNFFDGLITNFNPTAFAESLTSIADAFKEFAKEAPSKVIKSLAVALLSIAISMYILSNLVNPDQIYTSFAIISGAIIELVLAVMGFNNIDMNGVSAVLLSMSVALLVLILGIARLSKIAKNGGDLSLATGAILGLFLGLAGVLMKFGELKKSGVLGDKDMIEIGLLLISFSKALLTISGALIVFAIAAKILEGVDISSAVLSLGALAATIAFLALAANVFKDTDFSEFGTTLILISTSLAIFAIAAKMLENTDLTSAVAAIGILTVCLVALMWALNKFQATDFSDIGVALIEISAALLIMAIACSAFALVKWESIGKAAVVLAVMIGVIALFAKTGSFLSKGIDYISDFAKAMLILSAAILAVSLALTLLTVSLSILSVIGTAAITAAVAALDILLIGLLGLSDTFVQLVSMLINVVVTAMLNQADTIVSGGITLLLKFAEAFLIAAPIILGTIDIILNQVIDLIMRLLYTITDSILTYLDLTLTTIVEWLLNFLESDVANGILNSLANIRDGLLQFLLDSVEQIFITFEKMMDLIEEHVINMIIPRAFEIVGELFDEIINGIVDTIVGFADTLFQAFIDLFNGLADVINSNGGELADAIGNLVEAIFGLFGNIGDKAFELGKDIVQGLINGLKDIELGKKLKEGASNLWRKIQNTFRTEADEHSPSKKMYVNGAYIVEGLVNGIKENTADAENAASKLARSVLNASELAKDMDIDNTFTITPVLDLSRVQNGANSISNILSGKTLNANINGISGNVYKPEYDLLDEIRQIKLTMPEDSEPADPMMLADIIKEALNGSGIYMDRDRVGKLVTNYQNNTRRATGAAI